MKKGSKWFLWCSLARGFLDSIIKSIERLLTERQKLWHSRRRVLFLLMICSDVFQLLKRILRPGKRVREYSSIVVKNWSLDNLYLIYSYNLINKIGKSRWLSTKKTLYVPLGRHYFSSKLCTRQAGSVISVGAWNCRMASDAVLAQIIVFNSVPGSV